MPFPSAKDLRKSQIVPFPVIGRAICCAGGAQQPRGHTGRASFAFLHASEGARQGHGYRGGRPEPARAPTPGDVAALADLDRGLEMAQHKSFTMATDVQVYFCDPQSPWQRGSNENTNGLLRQYLPKKEDLSCYSQSELDEIALRLNQRPRKTLGFQTPADRLQASVASTP